MINIVNEYNEYLKEIPKLIGQTYYKSGFFIKELGISQATYYRKLRENTFNSREVTILTKLLFPKETYLEEIKMDMIKSNNDIKQGKITAHEQVNKKLKKRYS